MEWCQTPPGPPRTVCSDRPAAQNDMPRSRSSPDPGTRRLSACILRSARYQDRGQRRGRQQAIPAQKKSTGPQGALRHQQSLYDLPMYGETRRQHGGHRKSSRPPVQPHQTDQTPGTGDSLPTGPDVSHLSESSPIPRPGEPPAQGSGHSSEAKPVDPQTSSDPPRSRRATPTIFGEQLKRDVSVNNIENNGELNSGQSQRWR